MGDGEDPTISDDSRAADEEDGECDFESGALDRELCQIVTFVLDDGD